MADNATEMRSHEAVPLKEGNTLLSELLSGYVYVKVKMPLYVKMSFICWIIFIFQNRSLLKVASYVSTIKGFFRLQTILAYMTFLAHELYVLDYRYNIDGRLV
jgi:hypothetical protein